MTTENDQREYDELRWLARDTQRSRRRGIWLTAGLTLGAIALAGAYVSRNQNAPQPTADDQGRTGPVTGTVALRLDDSVRGDLAAIRTSLDSISRAIDGLNGTKQLTLGDVNIEATPIAPLGNVVWLLEGSRRFPMAVGDVLWVPEASRWMRLVDVGTDDTNAKIALWQGDNLPPESVEPHTLPYYLKLNVERGAVDCIAITSEGGSDRGGFRLPAYVNIDVQFFTSDNQRPCPAN